MSGRRRAVGVLIALLAALLFVLTANGPTATALPAGGSAPSSALTIPEDEHATHAPVVRTVQARRSLRRTVPALATVGGSFFPPAASPTSSMPSSPAFPRGPDNLGRLKLILNGIDRC